MKTHTLAAALCATLLPFSANAAVTLYVCALDVPRAENWVPEQLVITHDSQTGVVKVNDPIINHFIGIPVDGTVAVDNTRRTTFAWDLPKVKNPKGGQYTPSFKYRATIQKASNSVAVMGQPLGYPNHFRADGRCTKK